MLVTVFVTVIEVEIKKIILTQIVLKPTIIFNECFAYIKKNLCNLLLLRKTFIFVEAL